MKKLLVLMLLMTTGAAFAGPLTLFADSFDDNNSNVMGWYRQNKSYIKRYTGSPKKGVAALRLRKNYQAIVYLKTAPYRDMKLTFKMAAKSLERGEYIRCSYHNGSSWKTVKTLSNGSDNGSFRSYSFNIPNCTYLRIRFHMKANSTGDYGYVDDVKLTGYRK